MRKSIEPQTFWSNVGKVLFEKGLSWSTLASLSGLSAQSISSAKYLNSQLTISTVIRIATVLGKLPSELFWQDNVKEPLSEDKLMHLIMESWRADPASGILMLFPAFSPEVQKYIILNAKKYLKENINERY